MLKIKDNVDLKELEKFGFELNDIYGWRYEYKNSENIINNDNPILAPYKDINVVCLVDNNLYIHCNTHLVKIPDIIYDLIKADLVEKVGDDNE